MRWFVGLGCVGKRYYPFGMTMPGRKYQQGTSTYRYGFNGQEKDNSTGEGNLDFGARIMDVRLGRWLSVDALAKKLPSESPYSANGNSPIFVIDRDGDYRIIIHAVYDYLTGKFTVVSIESAPGLMSKTVKDNFNPNTNTWTDERHEWYNYYDISFTTVNRKDGDPEPSELNFLNTGDVTFGASVATTRWGYTDIFDELIYGEFGGMTEEERAIDLANQGKPRNGIMYTTANCKGCHGAGVWGQAENIENLDGFKEAMEGLVGNALDLGELANKAKEIFDKYADKVPLSSPGTDDKNKPEDIEKIKSDALLRVKASLNKGQSVLKCTSCGATRTENSNSNNKASKVTFSDTTSLPPGEFHK